MSSGYFPISPRFDEGKKLLEALKLLKDVSSSCHSGDDGALTPEDTKSDGRYLARIDLAIDLVAPCIEGHVAYWRLAQDALAIINKYLPPDSGISEHDALSDLIGLFDGPKYRAAVSRLPLGADK